MSGKIQSDDVANSRIANFLGQRFRHATIANSNCERHPGRLRTTWNRPYVSVSIRLTAKLAVY
jgi:hypothetical protein